MLTGSYDGKKIIDRSHHYVVRGNQKNYVQFMNYNLVKKTDNIYFEDIIAKAILFRAAEKIWNKAQLNRRYEIHNCSLFDCIFIFQTKVKLIYIKYGKLRRYPKI